MMKKIVCFTDSFSSGGSQKQMVLLANGLCSKGHHIDTLQYHDLNFFTDDLDKKIVINKVLSKTKLTRIIKTTQFFIRKKPDIIISFLPGPNFYSSLYKLLFPWRKVILITGERSYNLNGLSLNDWLLRIPHFVADKVVVNSNSQKMLLDRFLSAKTIFIPNGIKVNRASSKATNNLKSKKLQLITLARLKPEKNSLGLVKALNHIKNEIEVQVHWYGRILEHEKGVQETFEFVKAHGLTNDMIFHEPIYSTEEMMSNADGMILPSFYEGCSNAIIEGMTAALPILASDVSDNKLILAHQKEFLFDPNKPSSIANSIKLLSNLSQEQRVMLGQENRQKAIQLFDATQYVKQFESLFNQSA